MSSAAGPAREVLCYVCGDYPDGGGAEREAHLQAQALQRLGWRLTVVCAARRYRGSGAIDGVEVRRVPRPYLPFRLLRGGVYAVALFLALLPRVPRYPMLHVHGRAFDSLVACFVAWLWRRPYYITTHGAERGPYGAFYRAARRLVQRRARFVQSISPEITAQLLAAGVRRERVLEIGNGIDLSRFLPATAEERSEARRRLQLDADAIIVLFTGRFGGEKGLDVLAQAWRELAPAGALLCLVGAREDEAEQALRLFDGRASVLVRGWTADVASYYAAADVFVLPSRAEGMSLSLMEAMAAGLPVIATAVGAAETMVADGESGLLVPADDLQALAAALGRLLADASLRARLGTAAARVARQRYAIESVAAQVAAAYSAVLGA